MGNTEDSDMQPPAHPHHNQPNEETIVEFFKGRHLWRFRCAPGEEQGLIDSITRLARDGAVSLDYFDAAVLSEEILGRARPSQAAPVESIHSMQTHFEHPRADEAR